MPSLQAMECLYHLVQDADFQREFRRYVKDIYRQGKHKDYGLPNKWESFIRQLNRIKAFAEGSGKQSRSGRRLWERGLGNLLRDFFDFAGGEAGKECLRDRYGGEVGQDKLIGLFQDILSEEEAKDFKRVFGDKVEFRGPFSDYMSLRNYLGELMASAPLILGVVCGKYVMIMGSNPEKP